jgi:hypothetical protein
MSRLVVTVLFCVIANYIGAQVPDSTFWAPNGPVNSLALRDSTLYVAGDFDNVAPVTGSFVRLDTTSAEFDPSFFRVNGTVHAMYRDENGYIYVGGNFSRAGNQVVYNIFRVTPQGQFDNTFQVQTEGPVYALTMFDSVLYIGGNITQINGELRQNCGAYDLHTNALNDFNPQINGPVYTIEVDTGNGFVYVGGNFSVINGFGVPYIGKLFPTFGNPFLFNAVAWSATPNANGPVYDIELLDTVMMIAGEFTGFANINRAGLAFVAKYTGQLKNFPTQSNGSVYTILKQDSLMYFCGDFTIAFGSPRSRLACVSTSLIIQPWAPNADDPVRTICFVDSTTIFAGGDFRNVGAYPALRGALIETSGTVHNWNPLINKPVISSMGSLDGKLYAGGEFFAMNGVERTNFYAVNLMTGALDTWSPRFNYPVNVLHLSGDTLYVAGIFTIVDQQQRTNVAAFDCNTQQLTSFNPGVIGIVRTFAVDSDKVYMGGNFNFAGGQYRDNIARVDKFNSAADSWNPGCNGTVNSILLSDNHVYVAGYYPMISGESRNNLSRLHKSSGDADLNWICDTDEGIYHAEFVDRSLIIGGWFTTVNGSAMKDLAYVDTATHTSRSFGVQTNGFVRTFTRYENDYYFSGNYTLVNNNTYRNLCVYDTTNAATDVWNPFPNYTPVTMCTNGQRLATGGPMSTGNGMLHPYLHVYNSQWITGIHDAASPNIKQLSLFPVPATDFITVKVTPSAQSATFTIFDMNSRAVQTGNLSSATSEFRIDISALPDGMYMLSVCSANGESDSSRFLKSSGN